MIVKICGNYYITIASENNNGESGKCVIRYLIVVDRMTVENLPNDFI